MKSFPLSKPTHSPRLLTFLWAFVALAVAWAASTWSPLSRHSDRQVPKEPFRHVYVQSKVGSATKCLVTDRAGATVRRSEPELGKTRWKCEWTDGPDGPVLSAITGKEPSYLFLPAAAVHDPALPLVYEPIRKAEDLPLPRVRWVHLFHDRRYKGFYLQIRLPDKQLLEKKELGRGEFLETRGGSATCWNRKLMPDCLLWNSAFIAESIFPEPAWTPGSALLHRLLAEAGFEPRAFVLTEQPWQDHRLWPWPLPVELSRPLRGKPYHDRRYESWARPTATAPTRARATELGWELPEAKWARNALEEVVSTSTDAGAFRERLEASPTLAWLDGAADGGGG